VEATGDTDSTVPDPCQANVGHCTPTPDCQTEVAPTPAPAKTKPEGLDQVLQEVWNYYLEKLRKCPTLYRFTEERRRKGAARLEECLRIAAEPKLENAKKLMKICVDRLAASAFHNGDNPGHRKYVDWSDHLFPSEKKLISWLDDDNYVEPNQGARNANN
jgi:hypothetical protein